MKTRITWIAFFFGLFVFMSCTDENEIIKEEEKGEEETEGKEETGEKEKFKSIYATLLPFVNGTHGTRADISVGDVEMNVVWSPNDTLGVFPAVGEQTAFIINEGSGTDTAVFGGEGWLLETEDSCYAYYPFDNANSYGEKFPKQIPVSMMGQSQSGDNDTRHLNKRNYMAAHGTISSAGEVRLTFSQLTSILRLNLCISADMVVSKVCLSSKEDNIYIGGLLDLTEGEPGVRGNKTGNLEVSCSDLSAVANHPFTVYMMTLPLNLQGKELEVTVLDSDGVSYSTTFSPTENWEAGAYYEVDLSLHSDTPSDTIHYNITNRLVHQFYGNMKLTKFVSVLPLPQTNEYQSIANLSISAGEVLAMADSENKYVLVSLTGANVPQSGTSYTLSETFDVYTYPVKTDFGKITQIYDYDTNSMEYKRYLGARGDIVDPNNSTIRSIGNQIWSESADIVDYARKCYEYVACHYEYLNPNQGLSPLDVVLTNGGGDCGNLTSIYVSLLRYKSIPSKHIVTIVPNGTYHVWCDFYLEKYGWIPVDVTFKNGNPQGDYFGYYDGNGIVVSKDVYHSILLGEDMFNVNLLQVGAWWYWWTENDGTGGESTVHQVIQN